MMIMINIMIMINLIDYFVPTIFFYCSIYY